MNLNVDKGKAFSTEVINRKGRGKKAAQGILGQEGNLTVVCTVRNSICWELQR